MSNKSNSKPLFWVIALWVLISIVAYTALSALWGEGGGAKRLLTGWTMDAKASSLERIKTTLTAIGGIGAVAYLVIKFRERSASENGAADEKLLNAVRQLGSTSPQVRIAGVYALADVADTYKGSYNQRVVDILCGYLRTNRLLKKPDGTTLYANDADGNPDPSHPLSADGATESTILSTLTDHLRSSNSKNLSYNTTLKGPWSECTIDIHSATIVEKLDLSGCHIKSFFANHTVFIGSTIFDNCRFLEHAQFTDAIFEGDTHFRDALFKGIAQFQWAKFKGNLYFRDAIFESDSHFQNSEFRKNTYAQKCTFGGQPNFQHSTFTGFANFQDAVGLKLDSFRKATFLGGKNFKNTSLDDD